MSQNKCFKWINKMITAALCLVVMTGLVAGCGNNDVTGKTDTVRVGSLKGSTSMGLLFLMEKAEKNEAAGSYDFTMAVQADELAALLVKEELDIALVPANVASILYHRMEGEMAVIDINTLGVLYLVTGDNSITSVEDLKGRTVYLTGKGTTPDHVLRYLLAANGLSADDCDLEYRSEASEVAAILAKEPNAVGLLPQPFATAACAKNQALSTVLDMNVEWEKLQGSGRMLTGVTVVRKAFLEDHEEEVKEFLQEHRESTQSINEDPKSGAALAVKAGIIEKEAIAVKAIPNCNITFIDGAEMKQALSGYLKVLYEQDPKSVGGSLPLEDFYYIP